MKYRILLNIGVFVAPCFLHATEMTAFDDEMLKIRGIDTSVAKKLSAAPSFMMGEQTLKVYVNDEYKNDFIVNIEKNGKPCFTKKNLTEMGIVLPSTISPNKNECVSLASYWPTSNIIDKPSQQAIWIFVPERAVDSSAIDNKSYSYGGYAGIANYSAQVMGGSGSASNDMYFLNNELGFNAENWIFRSLQIFTHSNESKIHHQYAYGQTTLEGIKKNLQVGQINLNNSVVGTSRVVGLQLFPEMHLSKGRTGGHVVVSGVASESSMVEIYQSGRLIYNTAVPAGAFELTQFSLLNRTNDLHVFLKGVNGSEQNFVVPASTFFATPIVEDTDYTFGLGRYDEQYAKTHPMVASVSKGWGIFSNTGLQFGTVFTQDYYNLGMSLSAPLSDAVSININNSLSHDDNHKKTGGILTSSINYSLANNLSVGGNFLFQSKDYAYLSDSVNDYDDTNNRQKQFGLDMSWSGYSMGSFNSSVGRTYLLDNDHQDYISFSWSKNIFDNYLFSSTFQRNYSIDNRSEDSFYLRLSIPLERANVSTWANHSNNTNRVGARYNNYVDRDRNWGVAYEHNDSTHYQSVSGNISTVTPYTQIGGNIQRSNENQTYWGGSLSGGATWVKEGLLLSPYEIKDTFGIAKAGDKRFVRLESNAGPTWTNGDGYAVVPSLVPYSENAIRVDTRSLSRHSDIQNAYKSVKPAKGTVAGTEFSITNTRRVLMKVRLNQGLLPANSVINDSAGNFLTLATKNGEVFLSNGIPGMIMNVETPDAKTCKIQLHLPESVTSDVLYEEQNEECIQ